MLAAGMLTSRGGGARARGAIKWVEIFHRFIPDYLVFFVFFTRLPGFHKKMYQITWCAQPGGPDYLVFTKFAPDYLVPQKRGDQITWATFGHKVDQITW